MVRLVRYASRFVGAVSLASVALPASAQPPQLRGLDAYISKSMKEWEVPGLAISVVKNDSIVYARGFGVKKLGDPAPVTERTQFAIGSASKAFTAAAVAMLVDEGKVRWDDPATRHLPGFQMYDPYVTRELSVRDLLSHRSGLARGDLLWYGSSLDRDEILRRVRFLKPSWSLRSTFGYQNLMYLAAGQVVAGTSGRSWDDFIRERIFVPLGMTASSTSIRALTGMADVAQPHSKIDDTSRVVQYRNIDNIAPAGSINSNVIDMAQWVRLQLNSGKAGGKQLISAGNFAEMHTPHTVIRMDGPWKLLFPDAHLFNYGLGWFLQDHRGRFVVHHGGNIDGMSALVAMMPEEKVGVVILTNMNGSPLPSAVMHRVFDQFLNAPPKDYSAEMRKVFDAQLKQAREAQARIAAQRVTGTSPSLALAKYAGSYVDSLYGEASVRHDGGKLSIKYGSAFDGDLEHWHYDTFRATWRDRTLGRSFVTFVLNGAAQVSELKVENLADFQRVPAKADTTPGVRIAEAELAKYAGKFGAKDLPLVVDVQLVGGALKVSIPGQPTYTLVPVTQTRFKLTDGGIPEGFFLDYTFEGGKVTAVKLEQRAPQPTLVLGPVGR